ncbi:hypothetical protein E4U43_005388 [Claviceps pusilla]|uniref:Uncharacterized protein n=1 Tax=Claviceps pusilla TaxID=123648 RepID=A0A9P7SU41_9HYPO|nr:hypothetical protein E4U43_005388 [Claviceps pusilla]
MKLNIILGALFMGHGAFASPVDIVDAPQELTPAHLEARGGPAYCCVGGTGTAGVEAQYISTLYPSANFYGKNGCSWDITVKTNSCDGWAFHFLGCTGENTNLNPGVQPAAFCKNHGARIRA